MEIEGRLSQVLSEFARTMVTDFPIQAILDRLVVRIVDVLPITSAGVTLISAGVGPRYLAASDQAAMRFEQLQTDMGEGPCLATFEGGTPIEVPDLRADGRFPAFASRALDAGLAAVFTFPLRHGEARLGALDLYRNTVGPLDEAAVEAAQTLADVAAAYLLNAQARTELQAASDRAAEAALRDSLTGLPTRALLVRRIDSAILRGRRAGRSVAILFADLDQFKAVNDLYGHHVGDQLLMAVAKRLGGLLRPGDTLARMAGDEFVILCEDLDDVGQAEVVAARVGTALAEPFSLSGVEVRVTASVGIGMAGWGTDAVERALRDADTAMYQAKRKGGGRHQVVDVRERQRADRRDRLGRDLRGALVRDELQLEYQPIVATANGRMVGAEALLRWAHPNGFVEPGMAVPLAERSGQIHEIGQWVLERACLDSRRWQTASLGSKLGISVNVSAHQLMTPDFALGVAAVLTETGTSPEMVTLEVTESVFVSDDERALSTLNDLKYLGVRLALDDFGMGYSSLSYLKRFPFDTIKIDRAFIADLGRDPASHLIVNALVEIAHGLSMTVIAEGVETEAQRRTVLALGCEASQGHYFARPMRADDLHALLVDADGGRDVSLPVAKPDR